jgi:hypothetical protein
MINKNKGGQIMNILAHLISAAEGLSSGLRMVHEEMML